MSQNGLCGQTNPFVTLWKEFRGQLLIGQRLSFTWLFMSHQGLFGLPNPFATSESSFGGYIWLGSESFSFTVYESTGAMGADESIRHLWKEFQGQFLNGHRVRFLWLFMSQQRLWGLTNPFVTLWKEFRGQLLSGQRLSFPFVFICQQGLCGLTNPFITCESSFRGRFWEGTTQFFMTVYESKGAVWADESIRHLWKEFRGLFLNGHRISFHWLFMSQQRLWGLMNPFVTCEKTFKGNFWVGSD